MTRFAAVALVAAITRLPASAALPPVLDLMPKEAGIVVVVEKPRQVVQAVAALDAYQNLSQFPQVREYLNSTPVRRFYQFVAHVEAKSGSQWPELLDKIAGGGLALGIAVGADPAPALLIARGTDAAASEKAFAALIEAVTDAAATEGSEAPRRSKVGPVETIHVGQGFHAARDGSTIYFGSTEEALKVGLTRPTGVVAAIPTVAAARKLAGDDPAAWGWFNLAKVKESQASKDFFEATRKDFLQTLVIGGTVDAVRRSDFVAFHLHLSPGGYKLGVKLPAKRADLDAAMRLHVPPAGTPGSKPLLAPPGVLYSQSFYLDLAHLWKNRKTMLNDEIRGQLEKADKDISKVLPGTTFGKLLEGTGAYHRLVMAQTGEKLYDRKPGQPIPPAAAVISFRDPAFGKAIDPVIRGGMLLAGFQTGWTMTEETTDGVTIVSYRFPEKGEPKFADPDGLRFSAVPSFAVVGDSLVVASSPGIIKALIPELRAEGSAAGDPAVWRAKFTAAGAAAALKANPDSTITNTVLTEGIGLAEATKQVAAFTDWLAGLGAVTANLDHGTETFSVVVEWKTK